MSRRSRRRARQRLKRNQRIRRAGCIQIQVTPSIQYATAGAARDYLRRYFDREYETADRMASLGYDVRDEHTRLDELTATIFRPRSPRRGHQFSYGELDGIPVCITDDGWCLREAGHTGPHVYDANGNPA
jgi:hypothetical protein